MIEIAIVEDEDSYAEQLNGYVKQYEEETRSRIHITRFSDGDEITEDYKGSYDIILMDIQMEFMDGMTAAEQIRSMDTEVVIMFITNMTSYAIRGYQVDAMDYVLKPVTYFDFSQKLTRAIGKIAKRKSHPVTISSSSGMIRLDAGDIWYLESQGHQLIYHTRQGEFQERRKMQEAEEAYEALGFFRSNKGVLVNLEHVEGVQEGCCIVHGERLPVSRARRNDFMSALTEYIGER